MTDARAVFYTEAFCNAIEELPDEMTLKDIRVLVNAVCLVYKEKNEDVAFAILENVGSFWSSKNMQ
jgi:hypothetical protein